MGVASYKDLVAWQRAMDLVEAVYAFTRSLPREESFGLTLQLRRAAVSVASNIAEGQGRGNGADFARFLRVARGSVQEVETQLLICLRLQYATNEQAAPALALVDEISRLLKGLSRSLPSLNS